MTYLLTLELEIYRARRSSPTPDADETGAAPGAEVAEEPPEPVEELPRAAGDS